MFFNGSSKCLPIDSVAMFLSKYATEQLVRASVSLYEKAFECTRRKTPTGFSNKGGGPASPLSYRPAPAYPSTMTTRFPADEEPVFEANGTT